MQQNTQTLKGFRDFLPENKKTKNKIAVFIDGANFEISLKTLKCRVDYNLLLEWLNNIGKITILRYYSPTFNNRGQGKFFTFLKKRGFKLITKNLKRIKKKKNKANFDVEITFDSAILLNKYDTIFLFSGDSDFTYLLAQLKKRGKYTIVISTQPRTARELRKEANKYLDLKNCNFTKKRAPFRERSQRSFNRNKKYNTKKKYVK